MSITLKESAFSDLFLSEEACRWKVDGAMRAIPSALLGEATAIFQSCKARRAESAETDFSLIHGGVRYRGVELDSVDGVVFVLRRMSTKVLSWQDLLLPQPLCNLLLFNHLETKDRVARGGLILILGKSDSGKSSTLNALIHEICMREPWMVLTFEDPVETIFSNKAYALSGAQIIQREMNSSSFAMALRSAVRANADVIKVSEIRDREGAHMALDAAMAGHLVLSTMHAASISEGVERLCEMIPESGRDMVASALRCCVHQQFVRQVGFVNRLLRLQVLPAVESARNRIRGGQFSQLNAEAEAATQKYIYSGRPISA